MGAHEDRRPPSPIELLLPSGFAETALVLGDACPDALAPSAPEPGSGETAVDLIIVAPSQAQKQDPRWVEETARRTALRLAAAGIAYVLPASARAVRRALHSHELQRNEMLLHVPDTERSHHVVPLGTAAAHYALSGQVRMKSSKRVAARALLHSRWLADRAPTGLVFRREASAPLASWLTDLDPPSAGASTLVSRRSDGGAVLLRFPANEPRPDAVAKVSRHAARELDALRMLAPAAARAGVRVPDVIFSGTLNGRPWVLQSAVAGNIAARMLEQRRLTPGELHELLAEWLVRWGRLSRRERPIRRAELERLVLSPAARLLPDQSGYRQHLSALCAQAVGLRCPFVANHGDLTTSNILIDETLGLGVVDWEEASAEALPLTDYFYATADAVAAVGGYTDRPRAFVLCFGIDGEHTQNVRRLTHRVADALDVDDRLREICFHACWLHHADNEASRRDGNGVGAFASILRRVAAEPERFAPTRKH